MIKGNVNPDNEFGRVSVQNRRIKLPCTLDRANEGIGYRWIRAIATVPLLLFRLTRNP